MTTGRATSARGGAVRSHEGGTVLDRVEARLPEVVRDALARAHVWEPAPDAWPPPDAIRGLEADVSELVRHLLARIEGMHAGVSVRSPVVPALRDETGLSTAANRALLRATVEVVHDYVEREFAGVVGDDASPAEGGPLGLRGVADCVLTELGGWLALAQDRRCREPDHDREAGVVALLRRVLHGELKGTVEALRGAGVDFSPPFVLMGVTTPSRLRADVEHAARQYAARLDLPVLPVCFVDGAPGRRGFAVLVAPRTDESRLASRAASLHAAANATTVTVVVDHVSTADGLAGALEGLRWVVGLARIASSGQGGAQRVFTLMELLTHHAAAAMHESLKARLLEIVLAPLMAEPPEWASRHLDLLRVRCAKPKASQAELASLLVDTRSAVRHRLDRIQALTGLRFATDQALFVLAVRVYDILEPDLPAPGDPQWNRRPLFDPDPRDQE